MKLPGSEADLLELGTKERMLKRVIERLTYTILIKLLCYIFM